jgi:hypothetical protein
MRDRFGLISRTTAIQDTYEWEKERFLTQPRDRGRILENVGDELGVFEEDK